MLGSRVISLLSSVWGFYFMAQDGGLRLGHHNHIPAVGGEGTEKDTPSPFKDTSCNLHMTLLLMSNWVKLCHTVIGGCEGG